VEARNVIRDNITPLAAELLSDEEIDRLKGKVDQLPDLKISRVLVMRNYINAIQIFFLVFIVTFPVAIPFLVVHDVIIAIRLSNGIALALLFTGGVLLARYAGLKPVLTALAMTAIGIFLVTMTILLGG
jgi:VIT1/CCC1 family predicted Fe2+/Mn2+ transporter